MPADNRNTAPEPPQHDDPTVRLAAGELELSLLKDGVKGRNLAITHKVTLAWLAKSIRDPDDLRLKTETVRSVLQKYGREGESKAYTRAKRQLPAAIPAAKAPSGTPVKDLPLSHHNGLYGFDIDENRESMDVATVRQSLEAHPATALVGLSTAGDALYVFMAGPVAQDAAGYVDRWKAISERLPGGARAASGKASKNFNRLRFLVHDPSLYLADEVTPFTAGELTAGNSRKSERKPPDPPEDPGDEVRRAVEYVQPDDDYNAWLGWLGTLKAVGLSVAEVESWAAQGTKHRAGEVRERWDGLPTDAAQGAEDKLFGSAYKLGWRRKHEQTRPRPKRPNPARDAHATGTISYNRHYQVLGLIGPQVAIRIAAGEVLKESRASLTQPGTLISLAPLEWWDGIEEAPFGPVVCRRLGDALIRAADELGKIDLSRTTARGAVKLKDGRVAFHLGDRLLLDGVEVDLNDLELHLDSRIWVSDPRVELGDEASDHDMKNIASAVDALPLDRR